MECPRKQEPCHDYAIDVEYPMHTVVETPAFLRRARECSIPDREREAMVDFLAAHPNAGDEMPGTGGARKVRFARPGEASVAATGSSRFSAARTFRFFCCRYLRRTKRAI